MIGVMGWRASQSITPQNDDLNKQGLFSQDVDVGDVDVRDVGDVRDMGTWRTRDVKDVDAGRGDVDAGREGREGREGRGLAK